MRDFSMPPRKKVSSGVTPPPRPRIRDLNIGARISSRIARRLAGPRRRRSGLFRDSTVHFCAFTRAFATAVAPMNARKSATYLLAGAFAMRRSRFEPLPLHHWISRETTVTPSALTSSSSCIGGLTPCASCASCDVATRDFAIDASRLQSAGVKVRPLLRDYRPQ